MGKGPIIAGLIVLVVLVGGVFALTNGKSDNTPSKTSEQTNIPGKNSESSTQGNVEAAATITYDGTSFSPATTTVKSGDKVTIKNASSGAELSFNSDPHPVHTDDTDLNAGDIESGQSKTITVTKKGTFGFHNHYNHSQHGTITIQ